MGFWLQNNYGKLLQQLNTSKRVIIKVINFDRGWFVSKATVQVTLITQRSKVSSKQQPTPSPIKRIRFVVHQRIKNGPFLIGKINGKSSSLLFAKGLIDSKSTNPNFLFNSTTLLHFNNTIETTLHIKKMAITNNQQKYLINNVSSSIQYNPKKKRLKTKTTVAAADIKKKQTTKFSLKNLSTQSKQYKYLSLWFGQRDTTIDKMMLYPSNHKSLEIDGFTFNASQTQKDKTTAITFAAHINSIIDSYTNIKPVDFKLGISELDTAALSNLIDTLNRLNRTSHQLTKQKLQQLNKPLAALLSQGFKLRLENLIIGTSDGTIKMTGKMALPKQPKIKDMPLIMLMSGADSELHLTMPMTLLNKIAVEFYKDNTLKMPGTTTTPEEAAKQLVQQWLDGKIFIQKGDNVNLSITLTAGQLLINGQPFHAKKILPHPTPKKMNHSPLPKSVPDATVNDSDATKTPNSN